MTNETPHSDENAQVPYHCCGRDGRRLSTCPGHAGFGEDCPAWDAYMVETEAQKDALLADHQFAPKYPVVCSCGFSAGFAMDNETPWIHHVAYLLREAGLSEPDPDVDLRIVPSTRPR